MKFNSGASWLIIRITDSGGLQPDDTPLRESRAEQVTGEQFSDPLASGAMMKFLGLQPKVNEIWKSSRTSSSLGATRPRAAGPETWRQQIGWWDLLFHTHRTRTTQQHLADSSLRSGLSRAAVIGWEKQTVTPFYWKNVESFLFIWWKFLTEFK